MFLLFAVLVCSVSARLPRVGIVHGENQEMQNLENFLLQAFPGGVDIWDASEVDVPFTWLLQFDALLVFADTGFQTEATCGNLASYLDQGGRVVTGLFSTGEDEEDATGACNFGEFNATYLVQVPIVPGGYTTGQVYIQTIFQPDHPIMQGVANISYTGWHTLPPQSFVSGSYIVADWTNNGSLVAVRDGVGPYGRSRVDLGFWPFPREDGHYSNCFWTNGTAGACPELLTLVVQSLEYTLRDFSSSASTLSPFWLSLLSYFF